MGDKNNVATALGADLLVKTGHGVIKAVYATSGDRTWVIRDGTSAAGAEVFTIVLNALANGPVLMPYINHPVADGIFIDNTAAGVTGQIIVVFE